MILNFFGDFCTENCLDDVHINEGLKKLLRRSTYNICNFEGPIKSQGDPINKTGPNIFNCKSAPRWLNQNNFKIISLANNHIMDFGKEGLIETQKAFNESYTIGAGNWDKAYKPLILEIEDIKIAFFSFTHCEFGTLTDEYDTEHPFGAAWINHDSINSIISETRKNVDYIIALPHGGYEHLEQPLPEWRSRYKALIDYGCDAIIASHPHIIQGFELYKNKPIFYSLGNFFFPYNFSSTNNWHYSLCVEIEIDNGIKFKTHPIYFSQKSIETCNPADPVFSYITYVNEVLRNKSKYISYINTQCDRLLDYYYPRLAKSKPLKLYEKILARRGLTIHPIDNSIQDILSNINNYRCESHRWCIARGLKNRFGIQ